MPKVLENLGRPLPSQEISCISRWVQTYLVIQLAQFFSMKDAIAHIFYFTATRSGIIQLYVIFILHGGNLFFPYKLVLMRQALILLKQTLESWCLHIVSCRFPLGDCCILRGKLQPSYNKDFKKIFSPYSVIFFLLSLSSDRSCLVSLS